MFTQNFTSMQGLDTDAQNKPQETTLQGLDTQQKPNPQERNNSGLEVSKSEMQQYNPIQMANNEIRTLIDETKPTAFNNAVEQWKQDYLFNQDKGFMSKTGKDVAGKSTSIMQDFDKFVDNWKLQNDLNEFSSERIRQISERKRANILNAVTTHDRTQAREWANFEGKTALENAINNGVANRNDIAEILNQAKNIEQLTTWQGNLENLDEETIAFHQRKNNSDYLSKIIDSKIQNRDLDTRDFFNRFKLQIDESSHEQYQKDIREVEKLHLTNDWFDQILSKSTDEKSANQMFKAYQPQMDNDVHESVSKKIKLHFKQKAQDELKHQNQLLMDNYKIADNLIAQGTTVGDDVLDFSGLSEENTKALQNYVDNLNECGDNKTDDNTYQELVDMSIYENDKFRNIDLTQYKSKLSKNDYQYFQSVQKSKVPVVQLKDTQDIINEVLLPYNNLSEDMKLELKVSLNRWVDSEIFFAEKEKGKSLTFIEKQEIIFNRAKRSLDKKIFDLKEKYRDIQYGEVDKDKGEKSNIFSKIINKLKTPIYGKQIDKEFNEPLTNINYYINISNNLEKEVGAFLNKKTVNPKDYSNDIRHQYASAIFTRNFGPFITSVLGWFNEEKDANQSGVEDSEIDSVNNKIGREYGLKYPNLSKQDLLELLFKDWERNVERRNNAINKKHK